MLERNALLRMGEERRIEARELHLRVPAAVRFAAPGPDRSGGEPVRQERLPGRAHHARRVLHQRHARGTAGRPHHGQHGRRRSASRPRVSGAPPTKPKSYFVRDVFQQVVFPDQDVAVRSARVLQQERVRALGDRGRRAGDLGAAAVPARSSSYLENQQLVAESDDVRRQAVRSARERATGGPLAAAPLESAEPTAARLAQVRGQGPRRRAAASASTRATD